MDRISEISRIFILAMIFEFSYNMLYCGNSDDFFELLELMNYLF